METELGWGDSDGGRPSYTVDEINKGILGSQIIFNTISDSVKKLCGCKAVCHQRRRAEPANPETKEWRGNNITAEDGKYYIIRLYVQNNNPNGMDTVAEDTRVSFSMPDISSTTVEVNGYIGSSNARPSKYWDYIKFNSDVPLHLEYIHGSALLENNEIGLGGIPLSDDIVNAKGDGMLIGYDALDDRIPGCNQYINYVSIRVKVVYDKN